MDKNSVAFLRRLAATGRRASLVLAFPLNLRVANKSKKMMKKLLEMVCTV